MAKLFLGGLPTAPDIKLLHEAFGVPEPGAEFTHEEIEKVINYERHNDRYRTVTTAWRNELLRDENVEIGAQTGIGFRCLTPNERVGSGVKMFAQGTRRQGRSMKRLTLMPADGLDAVHAVRRDHALRLGGAVFHEGQRVMRELAPPKPVAQIAHMPANAKNENETKVAKREQG